MNNDLPKLEKEISKDEQGFIPSKYMDASEKDFSDALNRMENDKDVKALIPILEKLEKQTIDTGDVLGLPHHLMAAIRDEEIAVPFLSYDEVLKNVEADFKTLMEHLNKDEEIKEETI